VSSEARALEIYTMKLIKEGKRDVNGTRYKYILTAKVTADK